MLFQALDFSSCQADRETAESKFKNMQQVEIKGCFSCTDQMRQLSATSKDIVQESSKRVVRAVFLQKGNSTVKSFFLVEG